MISRVRGTQDFLDLSLFNFITESARQHFSRYNFTQIATPILEQEELFKRSLGMYTDVVGKEMFLIEVREGSDDRICLRPELTAPAVRAFLEGGVQHTPWKVFSIGPAFRYERPQKGRFRQFHQINLEVIGTQAIAQDIFVLTMLDRFFHDTLTMNNYALVINFLGCRDDRVMYEKRLQTFLRTQDICDTCVVRRENNTMRVFDCKSPACQKIPESAPLMTDHLCAPCASEWQHLQDTLPLLSISFVHRPTLVRGLDYYSKTVFEFVSDNLGAQNAFCGGGRYELASLLGARQEVPSIGVAIGIERLMILLEPYLQNLPIKQAAPLHAVIPLSDAQTTLAMLVADSLQAGGLATEVLLDGESLKSKMRQANRAGAAYAIMIGDDEQQGGTAMVKNMVDGAQEQIAQVDLVAHLKR